jgi:hypothetical protein
MFALETTKTKTPNHEDWKYNLLPEEEKHVAVAYYHAICRVCFGRKLIPALPT